MNQCEIVEKQSQHKIQVRSNDDDDDATFINRQFPNNPFSLFSGIVPGRWWNVLSSLFWR